MYQYLNERFLSWHTAIIARTIKKKVIRAYYIQFYTRNVSR